MFRVIKTELNESKYIEVIFASEERSETEESFVSYVLETASNGDEYTKEDMDRIIKQEYDIIGSSKISLDSVEEMTEEEFLSAGGGCCIHCHSDNVLHGELIMEDGYVSRKLMCEVCGEETVETYSLSGIEE